MRGWRSVISRLVLTEAARTRLVRNGYDPHYGARPLKRAIQREIENPLAKRIVSGDVRDGQTVKIDADPTASGLSFACGIAAAAATQPRLRPEESST